MKTPLAVWLALLAAALFGGSTPFVKLLIGDASALTLAGLLYLGSGLGLGAVRLLRNRGWKPSGLSGRVACRDRIGPGSQGPLALVVSSARFCS